MRRPAPVWNEILLRCGVKPTTAAIWSEIFAAGIDDKTFSAGDEDLRNFLAQVLHESAHLEATVENLNYSAEALARTWPNRYARRDAAGNYKRPFQPNGLAESIKRNPEKIANNCYANRMGNGDEASGDGWRYRGRGLIQCTGRANYETVERITGLPVVKHPDLLLEPLHALSSAVAWWEANVPDAVLSDPEKVTEEVNGGRNGLSDRLALTKAVTELLA